MASSLIGSTIGVSGGFIDDPLIGENYFGALDFDAFEEAGGLLPQGLPGRVPKLPGGAGTLVYQ